MYSVPFIVSLSTVTSSH